MAKNKNIKRIVTKNNQVWYYQDGKRLKEKVGKSRFVKQNNTLPVSQYTKGELRSLKAIETFNKRYKFNGELIKKVYVELLAKMGFKDAIKNIDKIKNRDLANLKDKNGNKVFPTGYFDSVLRMIDERAKKDKSFFEFATKKGMPGYRGRDFETFKDNKVQSVIDFVELLNSANFKSWNIEVTDMDGDAHYGRTDSLVAIRDFEIRVGERVKAIASNIALIQFNYNFRLDIPNKTILLDLREKTSSENKLLEDYVNELSTQPKDKPEINNVFNDVEITLMFS